MKPKGRTMELTAFRVVSPQGWIASLQGGRRAAGCPRGFGLAGSGCERAAGAWHALYSQHSNAE